jgi:hypothetical protein
MKQRIAKTVAAAFLGAGLLFGGQALAMEDLRIPVAMTSTTTALVEQTAIYKGFFKEIGYNARVYSVSGGENAAVLALERGQLPFFGSDDNIPLAIRAGSNIRVIGSEMNVLPYWLVAGKHVKSYKDLPRPVKVGISSPTSGNVYVSLKLLEAAGIPQKDTRLVKVGGSSARLAGVKGGKIDVGSLTFGMMLRAKKADLSILGAANQFVKEYAFLQLAMNKNYIKDNAPREGRCHHGHAHSRMRLRQRPQERRRSAERLPERDAQQAAHRQEDVRDRGRGSEVHPRPLSGDRGGHRRLHRIGFLDQVHRQGHQGPADGPDHVQGILRQGPGLV